MHYQSIPTQRGKKEGKLDHGAMVSYHVKLTYIYSVL